MSPRRIRRLLAVGLTGGAGLAYELALMRIMAVAEWHHFAYMIISIALLGFGAAGTYLAQFERIAREYAGRLMTLALGLLLVVLPLSFGFSQWIPFETYELTADPRQILYLLTLYLVLAAPFFLVSLVLVLGFYSFSDRIGAVYAANLLGSGAGAAGVVGALYVWHPALLPGVLLIPIGVAFWLCLSPGRRGLPMLAVGLVVAAILGLSGPVSIRMSPYKPLSYALENPDAKIVASARNPLSVVTAIRSGLIRETPGQLSNYPFRRKGPLPEQIGLFFDGTGPSVIHRLDSGPLSPQVAFLDYVTGALPYRLVEAPRVFVAGPGGGTPILMALSHGATHVTAAEVNPSVVPLMKGPFSDFSGGLYRRSDVKAVTADGRGYLVGSDRRYDVIELGVGGGYMASLAGVQALQADYRLTVEAVVTYLNHLTPRGVLAVSRWLQSPPRDAVKTFATLVEGAEQAGLERPGRHLAMVRSWNVATLVLSRSALTSGQREAIRSFSRRRWFDRAWVPGMAPEEANRFVRLDDAYYHRAGRRILGDRRERFYDRYPYYVRPATDDRPYHHRFTRAQSPARVVRALAAPDRSLEEWGYLVLWVTLFQSALLSLLIVVMPVLPAGAFRGQLLSGGAVMLYFGLLGGAYMMLEIGFIQMFLRFLHYPVYATAVVLTAFLVFSGLGSWWSGRFRVGDVRAVAIAVLAIAAWAMAGTVVWPLLFEVGAGWSDPVRVLVSVAVLAPMAVPMGMLFPLGLQVVADRLRSLVAWSWAANGAASVVGAVLARLLAVHLGLTLLVGLAAGLYLLGAGAFTIMVRVVE